MNFPPKVPVLDTFTLHLAGFGVAQCNIVSILFLPVADLWEIDINLYGFVTA